MGVDWGLVRGWGLGWGLGAGVTGVELGFEFWLGWVDGLGLGLGWGEGKASCTFFWPKPKSAKGEHKSSGLRSRSAPLDQAVFSFAHIGPYAMH